MNKPADLYERDFVLWAEEQARALREAAQAGANLPLDWENLAGRSRAWAAATGANCTAAFNR